MLQSSSGHGIPSSLGLCALSQRYNLASFLPSQAEMEEIRCRGGRNEGSEGSYTEETRPIQCKRWPRHLSRLMTS